MAECSQASAPVRCYLQWIRAGEFIPEPLKESFPSAPACDTASGNINEYPAVPHLPIMACLSDMTLSLNDLKTTIDPDLLFPQAGCFWPSVVIFVLKTNWFYLPGISEAFTTELAHCCSGEMSKLGERRDPVLCVCVNFRDKYNKMFSESLRGSGQCCCWHFLLGINEKMRQKGSACSQTDPYGTLAAGRAGAQKQTVLPRRVQEMTLFPAP